MIYGLVSGWRQSGTYRPHRPPSTWAMMGSVLYPISNYTAERRTKSNTAVSQKQRWKPKGQNRGPRSKSTIQFLRFYLRNQTCNTMCSDQIQPHFPLSNLFFISTSHFSLYMCFKKKKRLSILSVSVCAWVENYLLRMDSQSGCMLQGNGPPPPQEPLTDRHSPVRGGTSRAHFSSMLGLWPSVLGLWLFYKTT